MLGQVQVFNTHVCVLCLVFEPYTQRGQQLFAKGGEWGPEWQRAHRLVNAWELAKLVRQAAQLGRYVVVVSAWASLGFH